MSKASRKSKSSRAREKPGAVALPWPKDYAPTDKERAAIALMLNRLDQAPVYALAKLEVGDGRIKIGWQHPSEVIGAALWANALGTSDLNLAATLMDHIAQVARTGPNLTEAELNGMVSVVRGLAPADPTEALLAVQMAAIHNATMVAARRLMHVETPAQQDSAANMVTKLARTFVAQIETLKRYRTGGEQTIKVQHVTVNDGGQAIVGDIQHTGDTLK